MKCMKASAGTPAGHQQPLRHHGGRQALLPNKGPCECESRSAAHAPLHVPSQLYANDVTDAAAVVTKTQLHSARLNRLHA